MYKTPVELIRLFVHREMMYVFLSICLQFVDSSKGLGCTQCSERWQLERRLLLNPNKHDVHRTLWYQEGPALGL